MGGIEVLKTLFSRDSRICLKAVEAISATGDRSPI
jgi:hypothetical protein